MAKPETSFVELVDTPRLVPTVVSWIQKAWPKPERTDASVQARLCGKREPGKLPVAIVAMAGETPMGFVSLVLYEKGAAQRQPHWVDALYVEPDYRRRGLALRLLESIETKATAMGLSRLFALTSLPGLYEKAGWLRHKENLEDPEDVVMRKDLFRVDPGSRATPGA